MTVRQGVRDSLALLSARDRRLYVLALAIQMLTSLLDLAGVLLIGLTGALAVTTIQSEPPPAQVSEVAQRLGLGDLSDQALIGTLAALAAAVLLGKSLVSAYLTRRVFIFLANRQAIVSAKLSHQLLSQPLAFIQRRSSQHTAFALIAGAATATSVILGQLAVLATEISLLTVLSVTMLALNPLVGVGVIVFFALVALALQRAMGGWAARSGLIAAEVDVASHSMIQEALGTYREITVSHRRDTYVDRFQALRWTAARVGADTQFIGMLPKYVFESALVLGGFILAGFLFATEDAAAAVGSLAFFVAVGTRILPSLMRLQGATLALRGAAGLAEPTFDLARDLGASPAFRTPLASEPPELLQVAEGFPGFSPSVTLSRVSYTYPGSSTPAVQDVSLDLAPGSATALVGSSGAGKSTLADLILGVLEPQSGQVTLNSMEPSRCYALWPGAVAYVPQEVLVTNDSIRANVALGVPKDSIDDSLVWEALERAHLADYLRQSGLGLEAQVGERGVRFSGGQRQRLGLARALYSRPKLLVLDEATSALDATTEHAISEMIRELGGEVTTIVIAHRLSTVKTADVLVYLDRGLIRSVGSFKHLLETVPEFQRQAALMGID